MAAPVAMYGETEIPMPADFGLIKKKDAMSGLIPDDEFREVVSRLTTTDIRARRNALATMFGWTQNNQILSDMLTFEDGLAYKELEKSRDMMLPLMEAEMAANSDGKESITEGGETTRSAESDYHYALSLLRILDNKKGHYIDYLHSYFEEQKALK